MALIICKIFANERIFQQKFEKLTRIACVLDKLKTKKNKLVYFKRSDSITLKINHCDMTITTNTAIHKAI